MRMWPWGALAGVLMLTTAPGRAGTLEQGVLAELNRVRADPAGYAAALRRYRGYFQKGLVRVPGERVAYRTIEGVRPVDEAIAFLGRQPARAAMASASLLAQGAADHAADQGARGAVGHRGSDGSDPVARAMRHGGGGAVSEIIAYGGRTPADMVRILVVDDGVPDRGHRRAVFDRSLRFAGVACGPHKRYRQVCVIDLAPTRDATARIELADAGD